MTAVAYIPASAPFTAEQRAWLNGFLAGLLPATTEPHPEPPSAPAQPLLILYGSQTGSAERLAKALGKQAIAAGFAARVLEANAGSGADWKNETRLLVVTSTWGDGDPPDNATGFWQFLNSAEAPDLKHVTFAVLGLGDRNYSEFCGAGKKFDERLAALGATRLLLRVDCDLDFEAPAQAWMEEAVGALRAAVNNRQLSVVSGDAAEVGGQRSEVGRQSSAVNGQESGGSGTWSRKNPFGARVLVSRVLNGAGSAKETRHVEISLEGSGLSYEPGDALGVYPSNCPAVVGDILSILGCDGEEGVKAPDGTETSFRTALLRYYQVTQPAAGLLQAIAARSPRPELGSLLASGNKSALEKHLHGREVIDLLMEHPEARFAPGELVGYLRPLNPRLYSIASSHKAHPGEVHLCVGVVRYEAHGRARKGVCSTFLADRTDRQTPVPVFVQVSHGFRLPASPTTPIIMVGPGTGIAPFRSFLEERRAVGGGGRNWLFFGDQTRAADFLYRDEMEGMQKDGVLTRLDLAFSRDQEEKVYVQHRMVEQARELFGWLEEGAHFYVCGDARRMAKDVDAALQEVVRLAGGRTPEQAAEYVSNLKSQKRYQRDVY